MLHHHRHLRKAAGMEVVQALASRGTVAVPALGPYVVAVDTAAEDTAEDTVAADTAAAADATAAASAWSDMT